MYVCMSVCMYVYIHRYCINPGTLGTLKQLVNGWLFPQSYDNHRF